MTSNAIVSADVISSDKVEGTSVYNMNGDKLGSIDDLMIDKTSGQIRYAVMEFGGFLGMGTDRYPIPWTMLKYDQQKDGYIVPLDKSKLGTRQGTVMRMHRRMTEPTRIASIRITTPAGNAAAVSLPLGGRLTFCVSPGREAAATRLSRGPQPSRSVAWV
jgi:sporulation protein YlmC with PRC-barrel domain